MGVRRVVYGSLVDSPDTLKVLACLIEHDLDFEFVPVDLTAGENKQKQFLSMSPFGQVPVYEDGPIKQFECRGTIRSTAHQYGKKLKEELICWDTRQQAIVANWIDVEDRHFEPAVLSFLSELNKLPNQQAPLAEAEDKLCRVLDVYEAQLGKHRYLAMEKYTIADLLHLPNLQSLVDCPVTRKLIEARPRVGEWCYEILARPAWAKVLDMQRGIEGE